MIKYSELQSLFEQLNIRVEEFSIKNQDEEIEPYFLIYVKTGAEYRYADGVNYYGLASCKAYLEVDDLKDEVITNLENIFIKNGVAFEKSIEYIPDDRVFELLYDFVVNDG